MNSLVMNHTVTAPSSAAYDTPSLDGLNVSNHHADLNNNNLINNNNNNSNSGDIEHIKREDETVPESGVNENDNSMPGIVGSSVIDSQPPALNHSEHGGAMRSSRPEKFSSGNADIKNEDDADNECYLDLGHGNNAQKAIYQSQTVGDCQTPKATYHSKKTVQRDANNDKPSNEITSAGRGATPKGHNNLPSDAPPTSENKKPSPNFDSRSKKVGHYLLGSVLGEGSYGKVRMATHLISKQQVAIKVVTKKLLVLREAARRHFRREALLLQHVRHPNIVRLYEAMETSSSYYLVFELASGCHLLDHVSQRGRLTEEESRRYMRQIASAVDHLHKSGIVHRDLKLENFLLDDEGTIKLVDFGLSAICHETDHRLSTQCGSPVYAAPEVFAGRKYGKPVDIWSLGVCLFAMLTGRLPFLPSDNTSLIQLYYLILKGCTIPDHLSLTCQHLLRRMLDISESDRITIEGMLSHQWLTLSDDQPIKRFPVMPRKLQEKVINLSLVKYMCTMYRFSESDVITSVRERKLTASAATYNIFKDSIEAGKMTVNFPKESVMSSKKTSARKPKFDGSRARDSEMAASVGSITPRTSNILLADGEVDDNKISSDTRSRSRRKPQELNSYKASILVLKRSRHLLRPKRSISNSQGQGADCVLFGKLAPAVTNSYVYNDVIDMRVPRVDDDTQALALPQITSSNDGPCGLSRKTRFEVQGSSSRHYVYRNHAHSVDLDVKGVTPCWYDRNVPQYAHASYPYRHSHFPVQVISYNSHLPAATPPPPPPNSSLGSLSYPSRSSGQNASPSLTTTVLRDNNYSLARDLHSGHKETRNISGDSRFRTTNDASPSRNSGLARSGKDPFRPTLTTLRDPYGRDTWSKTKGERRSKGSGSRNVNHISQHKGESSRGQGKARQAIDTQSQEEGSIKQALASSSFGLSFPGDLQEADGGNTFGRANGLADSVEDQAGHSDSELGIYDDTGRESTSPWPRSEANSPFSQSQEKEDFMTPVTRVTITTIGRH